MTDSAAPPPDGAESTTEQRTTDEPSALARAPLPKDYQPYGLGQSNRKTIGGHNDF
jgi:hypothetical protein